MPVSRGLYVLLFSLILLSLGGLVASCRPTAKIELISEAQPMCNLPIPITENGTVNLTENKAIAPQTHDIPPIDTMAPAYTETATFSLG